MSAFTSLSSRYSRERRTALGRRPGGTVRNSAVGSISFRRDLIMYDAPLAGVSVRKKALLWTVWIKRGALVRRSQSAYARSGQCSAVVLHTQQYQCARLAFGIESLKLL